VQVAAALYNRYRPRTFAEVVGQEHVTAALSGALDSGRLHHAYLFSGPRGCGKTSSARILAASLNCEQGPTSNPCGVCAECVAIRAGSSVDVVELDAASHGLVDDARDLRERTHYAPASGRFRVFVIDEAHQLGPGAANALLKVVEEPPPHVVFIFATTEPEKVLSTIRSRTFSYKFRLVPPGQLRDHLAKICTAEGVEVAPEVLSLVVRAGEGSVRDSLSVLDQLIAGGATSLDAASALLGVTEPVLLDSAVDALSARDGAGLFGVIERVVAAGHDPRRFATDLLERLRDLVLLQAVSGAVERGLVEGVAPDQLERMQRQATSLGAAELSRSADVVHAGLIEMRGTTSPRLLLELVCARLLLPAADVSAASVLARLEAVERRITLSNNAAPVETPARPRAVAAPAPVVAEPEPVPAAKAEPGPVAEPPAPVEPPVVAEAPAPPEPTELPAPIEPAAPVAPAPAAASVPLGTLDATGLRDVWPSVLDAVKKRSRVPYVLLAQYAQVTAVEGDLIVVTISSPQIARRFQSGPGVEILSESLTEAVGGAWRVRIESGTPEALAPGPEGFAPGDEPEPEPPAGETSGPDGRIDLTAAQPPAREAADPVGLLKSHFGATVIE
jgi:DNA polymerase-3 subunit gamma/tau